MVLEFRTITISWSVVAADLIIKKDLIKLRSFNLCIEWNSPADTHI